MSERPSRKITRLNKKTFSRVEDVIHDLASVEATPLRLGHAFSDDEAGASFTNGRRIIGLMTENSGEVGEGTSRFAWVDHGSDGILRRIPDLQGLRAWVDFSRDIDIPVIDSPPVTVASLSGSVRLFGDGTKGEYYARFFAYGHGDADSFTHGPMIDFASLHGVGDQWELVEEQSSGPREQALIDELMGVREVERFVGAMALVREKGI